MMRTRSVFSFALLALCACSGGGGGTPSPSGPTSVPTSTPIATATPVATPSPVSTATPVATATPAPTPTASPGTGVSTYQVLSAPAGLGVIVTNGNSSSHFVTPVNVKPTTSNVLTTIAISPSDGAATYAVAVDQSHRGAHYVLYNQSSDTHGSIGSISATPLSRAAAFARSAGAAGVPRVLSGSSAGRAAYSDRDVIVRYRPNVAREALERKLGVTSAHGFGMAAATADFRVLAVPAGIGIAAFVERLRAQPEIASVERDALYYKQSTTPVVVNDTHFNIVDQWDLYDIGAPNAWGYTEGSNGVQIAMVDTGVDATLPDFSGGKIVHAESVLSGAVTVGAAAVQDTDGHGTNTAGIAAAGTDNGSGFAGTGFNTGLQIYRVFPADTASNGYNTSAQSSDVTFAVNEAVANGARVINLSLGSCQVEGVDSAQEAAIQNALAHNVVVVAASGNERSGQSTVAQCAGTVSTVDFPAAFPGVISVGATSLNDSANPGNPATAKEFVASYSNAGPGLSLVAPGGDPSSSNDSDVLHWVYNLYSTTVANPQQRCSNTADCKALFAGTSQATPHVAGAAALLLAKNPNLTPAQVTQILITTADDIGDPNAGNGRLDIYRALAALAGDPVQPARPANNNFVAIAYVPDGTNKPHIVDATYPNGAPVARDGTFRIAGVAATTGAFKIGVWYDANGDGRVDAGDYFGSSGACSSTAPCTSAAGIVAAPVTSGFILQ